MKLLSLGGEINSIPLGTIMHDTFSSKQMQKTAHTMALKTSPKSIKFYQNVSQEVFLLGFRVCTVLSYVEINGLRLFSNRKSPPPYTKKLTFMALLFHYYISVNTHSFLKNTSFSGINQKLLYYTTVQTQTQTGCFHPWTPVS